MTRILLCCLLALLPYASASAVEVDVYTGQAVVADQSAAERRAALPAALGHALLKLSGVRTLDDYPQAAAALKGAAAILVTSYYRNVEIPMADGSLQNELRLNARFSPAAVDELARSPGLPLWQPDRKPTEIWVVVDDGMGREVMPMEIEYVRAALDQTALMRGMPLNWPQPDEEGMYPVDMQLLWGGYTEDLASPRGDGVLILAARREGAQWSVRANLGFEGQNRAWRFRELDLQRALVNGLEQAIDQIAMSSAIAATDLGTWEHELMISGLRNPKDYQRCLSVLQGNAIVSRVDVVAAKASDVTFRLQLTALPQYLEDDLKNSGVFEFDEDDSRFYMKGTLPDDR